MPGLIFFMVNEMGLCNLDERLASFRCVLHGRIGNMNDESCGIRNGAKRPVGANTSMLDRSWSGDTRKSACSRFLVEIISKVELKLIEYA